MLVLPLPDTTGIDRATCAWAAAALTALARDEGCGRKPQRLLEPQLTTWARFRGRLGPRDLVALLFEDAAVLHPVPFDPGALDPVLRPERLTDTDATCWLEALRQVELLAPSPDYLAAQARQLGLSTRLARSELHTVRSHQRVLELPGTGGQLAHHLLCTQDDLTLRANFTVACGSWQELALAGIVALDRGAPDTGFAVRADAAALRDPRHPLRQRSYDFVVGLHPDKGGLFQIPDQLAIWFSGAKILLV